MIAAAEVRPRRQVSARRVYTLPWNTTSTLIAATNGEYFYDYADQDPINNYDLSGSSVIGAAEQDEGVGGGIPGGGGGSAYEKGIWGENTVRSEYQTGPKEGFRVDGRSRIADGLNRSLKTIAEVKNVASQSLTQQIRDYLEYAEMNGLTFNLYVREGADISAPLRELAKGNPAFNIIPVWMPT